MLLEPESRATLVGGTSKALMLELMAESLHPEIAQLIRCKNYSSKDLPSVAAPNHIGLESKICESLNYFRYTSIRSFSNVLLEPESRAKLVGGQDGGLSEEHIFSSHHMFCIIFGQGLWKFSSRKLKFRWSTAMCSLFIHVIIFSLKYADLQVTATI